MSLLLVELICAALKCILKAISMAGKLLHSQWRIQLGLSIRFVKPSVSKWWLFPWKTINNNDLNHVADQRFSLKQWLPRVFILAGLEKLVQLIVTYEFPNTVLKFTTMGHVAQCAMI